MTTVFFMIISMATGIYQPAAPVQSYQPQPQPSPQLTVDASQLQPSIKTSSNLYNSYYLGQRLD